jgi:serine/threonine protein kinase/formylglycine-generating enzyme required for sulfatase activity
MDMELTQGQQLAHYRIDSTIGQGGMGTVYRATDTRLDREVAIKVLPAEVTADVERRQRFRQEAMLAAAFNHPNIATVHDVGEQEGVTFIVMELVRGESLRSLVRAEPLDIGRAVDIATGIAAGLAKAHREGVLHRDLKPDNIVLTDDGVPKVLDFGLGKLIGDVDPQDGRPPTEAPTATVQTSPYLTRAGQIIGTLAYMSPEQVHGRPVDARSDVFSFGVLLYEMLSGKRPFAGESNLDTATAILRDDPAPLDELRRDVPSGLQAILTRCLEKAPEGRFASGQELHNALLELKRRLEAPAAGLGSLLRRPAILGALGLFLVLVGAGAAWLLHRSSRVSWARNSALPEIERLFSAGDQDGAMRLLYEASEIIPDDPYLVQYVENIGIPVSLDSDPPGATVYVKGYNYPDREWIRLGETPLENAIVSQPARFRVEKEAHATFEGAPFGIRLIFRLFREDEIPPGMVHVPEGTARFGATEPVALDAFWIDTYEVTNREYKSFVDDGGYRDDRFWAAGVDRRAFVDTTGRPGPAGWALGSYPEGEDDLPVGGVSWFEASAYAAWAGKSLPTVFHWRLAAQQSIFSEILLWSNFDTKGPAAVGSYAGLGPNGTYDMAGNVREWCLNRTGDMRHILGGAWSDPDYLYRGTDATDPHDRSLINGFRCMRTHEPPPDAALIAIEHPVYDHRQDTAVDDDVFAIVRQSFDYDDRDPDARVESIDDGPEYWRHEVVSVRAAYGDERLPIHLFLPKNIDPPYQAVVYFPPSSARYLTDSTNPSFPFAYFIPKSGRALVYPVYQSTYERQIDQHGPNDRRDVMIQIGKDLRRTIDFLETREDIDSDWLAFYGLSWGAYIGPLLTAIEPRFDASVLIAGGLYRLPDDWPPAAVPQNFAPRSNVPTLMVNGKADFGAPVETNIQPLFDMLGTPDEHKRLALLDGGHVPASPNEVIREVLDWLDLYLGPVDTGGRSIATSEN